MDLFYGPACFRAERRDTRCWHRRIICTARKQDPTSFVPDSYFAHMRACVCFFFVFFLIHVIFLFRRSLLHLLERVACRALTLFCLQKIWWNRWGHTEHLNFLLESNRKQSNILVNRDFLMVNNVKRPNSMSTKNEATVRSHWFGNIVLVFSTLLISK